MVHISFGSDKCGVKCWFHLLLVIITLGYLTHFLDAQFNYQFDHSESEKYSIYYAD